jgi:hypothetical protein
MTTMSDADSSDGGVIDDGEEEEGCVPNSIMFVIHYFFGRDAQTQDC